MHHLRFFSATLCAGKAPKTNIAHPTDASKYIACLNEKNYEIMDCPADLIYNAAADQCEKVKNTESICERDQPCMNEGQCHQTSPSTYKCTCRAAWTGDRCEIPLSSCAADPCGQGNECHTLKTNDFAQDFVCVCDGRQSYGLSCGRNTVPNPCLAASTEQEQYYPFAFSAQAFVQCNGDLLYVRPCAGGLYWKQEEKICDRIETSPAAPAQDRSESYQVTYGNQQQSAYARPTASFSDKAILKPQAYQQQPQQQQTMFTRPQASFAERTLVKPQAYQQQAYQQQVVQPKVLVQEERLGNKLFSSKQKACIRLI
jgi:hypothetical protein